MSTGNLLAVSLGVAAVGSRSGLGSSWTIVSPKGNSRPLANCARLGSGLSLQVPVTESIRAPLSSSHPTSHSKLFRLPFPVSHSYRTLPFRPCALSVRSPCPLSRSALSWSPAFLLAPVSYFSDLASEWEERFGQLWEGLPAISGHWNAVNASVKPLPDGISEFRVLFIKINIPWFFQFQ